MTDWIVSKLPEVVGRKRPDLLPALDAFLTGIDFDLDPVDVFEHSRARCSNEKCPSEPSDLDL